jgi:Arm DNA-binding domain
VLVSAKGKINLVVIRRLPGKRVPTTWRLGQYPILALAEAREAARGALGDIRQGRDPKQKKESARRAQEALRHEEARKRANSFAAVAEEFISRRAQTLRSAADVEATIRRELISRWGEKPVTEISRRDFVEAIEQIADSGRLHIAHHGELYFEILFVGRRPRLVQSGNLALRGHQVKRDYWLSRGMAADLKRSRDPRPMGRQGSSWLSTRAFHATAFDPWPKAL